MRTLLRTPAALLFLGLTTHPALADDVSCRAEVCSASIACPGPAWASCGSSCTAGCGSTSVDSALAARPAGLEGLQRSVTLNVKEAAAEAVSDLLGRTTGIDVRFFAEEPVTLDVKEVPAAALLQALSSHGVVTWSNVSPAGVKEPFQEGRLFNLLAQTADARSLSKALSELAGVPLEFKPDGGQLLTLEMHSLSATTIVQAMAAHGQVLFN